MCPNFRLLREANFSAKDTNIAIIFFQNNDFMINN
jgi:hypothetical protein